MRFKLVSIFMCLVLIFSFVCGCTECGSSKNDEVSDDLQLDTTHGGKHEATSKSFLDNGVTDYKLVIPVNATSEEEKTATVVQRYFYEATGVTLSIINDAGLVYNDTAKYISIGSTVLADGASIEYSLEDDTEAGFQIITKGLSIFLVGGQYGIVYAGYEICYYWFGLDYYASYCYSLDKNVRNLPLYDFNIAEIPDFKVNSPAISEAVFGTDPNLKVAWHYDRRYTALDYDTLWTSMHNTLKIVSWEENCEKHRNWFSDEVNGSTGVPYQLCYSRDPDGLIDYVLEKFKESAIANPDIDILPFSHEDEKAWCKCESCLALEKQYDGCVTVGYIRFMRKLADKLNAWGKAELGRDLKVQMLCYNTTEDVPTRYNKTTGEYELIDETCDLGDNVYIYYCPHPDYYVPLDHPDNEKVYDQLKSWSSMSNCMYVFLYNCTAYSNYFVFTGTFNAMQRNYQIIKKFNGQSLYDLGPYDTTSASAFNNLKAYLSAKLAWNCQLDFNDLVNRFFDNYFGAASEPMRNMYEACMNKLTYRYNEGKISWTWKRFWYEDTYYSEGFLNTLMSYVNQAYEVIEPLKETDYETYKTLYDRINLESLSPRYFQIEMYPTTYSSGVLLSMKQQFKADCTELKITKLGEGSARSIDTLYTSWGIA